MTKRNTTTRRDFIRQVGVGAVAAAGAIAAGAPVGAATRQAPSMAKGRVIGANDRINVGFVGCGGRMNAHIRRVMERNKERGDVQAVAVNDIWDKRKQRAREATGVDETVRLSRLSRGLRPAGRRRGGDRLAGPLAPLHSDGCAAQRQGRLPREADDLHGRRGEGDRRRRQGQRPRPAGRQPVHVDGSLLEGEESDQGRPARRGRVGVGRVRPQQEPAWRVELRHRSRSQRKDARLEGVPRVRRRSAPFDPERYFRWRKYWDYSGGIATDLFYHTVSPLLVAIGGDFPLRVTSSGGIYMQKDREVPDTFFMNVDYPAWTMQLACSVASGVGAPLVIHGSKATLFVGQNSENLINTQMELVPDQEYRDEFVKKTGVEVMKIDAQPVPSRRPSAHGQFPRVRALAPGAEPARRSSAIRRWRRSAWACRPTASTRCFTSIAGASE